MVGENIRRCDNVSRRALSRRWTDITSRMVSQGASQLNISMVVAAADLQRAVESLHREFFTNSRPGVI